jgi:alkylated DNA repair dioxygenase AlkB
VPTENSQPLFAFFSRPDGLQYRYFGRMTRGLAWSNLLSELAVIASDLVPGDEKPEFNAAFVNLYRNGQDCVTPHRDKTHGSTPIVSFSFYEDEESVAAADLRALSIAELPIGSNGVRINPSSITMEHASAIIMFPGMQERFVHWIDPIESRKFRVNVTFRIQ